MTPLRSLLVLVLLVLASASCPAPASADDEPVGVWPLRPEPAVVRGFEPPDEEWGSGHRGVDLAGSVGQPVHSALAGVVAYVGHIAGKPVVTVSHAGTRTTYEPVASGLSVGDQVAAGQLIGSLQLAFSHCFPQACLHWGWLRGQTYLDPLRLVGSTRVRLLPLEQGLPRVVPALVLPYATWSPLLPPPGWTERRARQLRPADVPAGRPGEGGPW